MPSEPPVKRAFVFIDGQNLFHAAKEAFGYPYPNYNVAALAERICRQEGWQLERTHFYTGIPDASDNAFWNHFWTAKLAAMGRQGVRVFSRPLRYRNQTVRLPMGGTHTFLVGQEKGIDIRIALDVAVRLFASCGALAQEQRRPQGLVSPGRLYHTYTLGRLGEPRASQRVTATPNGYSRTMEAGGT